MRVAGTAAGATDRMRIYLDHNATAPIHPEALRVWQELLQEGTPANPSSIHWAGQKARRRLSDARESLADLLGASPRDLIFTASGTEANAMALRGAVRLASPQRRRVLVSSIEHPSVHRTVKALAQEHPELSFETLAVDRSGILDLEVAQARLADDVLLVSLMLANNETGVLQPVSELAAAARSHGVLVHCDATQAVGKVPVDVTELGVDLLTAGGHKFGGGLGMGFLIARGALPLPPLLGGHQERGMRGGTENVAAIVAAAAALRAVRADLDKTTERIAGLRDLLECELVSRIPDTTLYGREVPRLPNTSLVGFAGASGEAVLIALDLEGIAASSGAACASGSLDPSHVLLAMGATKTQARSAVRFSLGRTTTEADIEGVLAVLPEIVRATRQSSPAEPPPLQR